MASLTLRTESCANRTYEALQKRLAGEFLEA